MEIDMSYNKSNIYENDLVRRLKFIEFKALQVLEEYGYVVNSKSPLYIINARDILNIMNPQNDYNDVIFCEKRISELRGYMDSFWPMRDD